LSKKLILKRPKESFNIFGKYNFSWFSKVVFTYPLKKAQLFQLEIFNFKNSKKCKKNNLILNKVKKIIIYMVHQL